MPCLSRVIESGCSPLVLEGLWLWVLLFARERIRLFIPRLGFKAWPIACDRLSCFSPRCRTEIFRAWVFKVKSFVFCVSSDQTDHF